jgi:hypothetical protein
MKDQNPIDNIDKNRNDQGKYTFNQKLIGSIIRISDRD